MTGSVLKIPKKTRDPCPKEVFEALERKQFNIAVALSYFKMAYLEEGALSQDLVNSIKGTLHTQIYNMSHNAIHTYIVIEIIKLLDDDSKSDTLVTIFKSSKRRESPDKELLSRIKNSIKCIKKSLEYDTIRQYRNKNIAHNSIEPQKCSYNDLETVYKSMVPIFEDIFEYTNEEGLATSKDILDQTDRIANSYIKKVIEGFKDNGEK